MCHHRVRPELVDPERLEAALLLEDSPGSLGRPATLDEVGDDARDSNENHRERQKPGPPAVGCEQHINLRSWGLRSQPGHSVHAQRSTPTSSAVSFACLPRPTVENVGRHGSVSPAHDRSSSGPDQRSMIHQGEIVEPDPRHAGPGPDGFAETPDRGVVVHELEGGSRRPPRHRAVFRSRYCRSSCAASSISLCRHSAAR
jgi:hypothetical protein